jgi:hypothetical protein
VPAFLAIWLWLPFVLLIRVESWPAMFGLYGSCTAMAAISWTNARTGRVPVALLLVGNVFVAVAASRLAGSFVLMPMIVCAQLLALSTHRWLEQRTWALVAFAVGTICLPLVLEQIGMLSETWRVIGADLVTRGTIAHGANGFNVTSLVCGQAALALVIALYGASFSRALRNAQRRAHRQAWHLQQMLPRGTSQLP